MTKIITLILCLASGLQILAQPGRWQQHIEYDMKVNLDVNTNKFTGVQDMVYTNNSPDTLNELFFHLYLNAFQPNSTMDERSRDLGSREVNKRRDWDERVRDRIQNLKEDEIGYQKITGLEVNGINESVEYFGTIAKVNLTKPILPGAKTKMQLIYDAQVPVQIRRTGRDNATTLVRYTMTQWYPKLCEYDAEGWHPTLYVAREFYGVWGNYKVSITLDKEYKLGGTGVLKNASEIGWGYDKPGTGLKDISTPTRTWIFDAKNVHDFAWAADPGYKHLVEKQGKTDIHIIYKPKDPVADSLAWLNIGMASVKALPFINQKFGDYPYPQYSFIHGGDGGMEYPMCTMMVSPSVGTAIHEWMHSWYQGIFGINESQYAWMDEGFTSYGEDLVTAYLNGASPRKDLELALEKNPENTRLQQFLTMVPEYHTSAYINYFNLQRSGLEEPLTTHADYFATNYAYSIASYSKGEVFLSQLGYIIGEEALQKTLLDFYKTWIYKHPNAADFLKVAEKNSDMQLMWYRDFFVNTTKAIDYSIDSVWQDASNTNIVLRRAGEMPMPIDLSISYNDGSTEVLHIPLNLSFGSKQQDIVAGKFVKKASWDWAAPTYTIKLQRSIGSIKNIEIDASKRMADVDRSNNRWSLGN